MFGITKWGFNGTVKTFHSENAVKLELKNSEQISLDQLVETRVPSFGNNSRFRLKPYLFNGALQAMYLANIDQQKAYKVFYGRELLQYENSAEYPHLEPGECALDYLVKLDTSDEEFKANYEETLPEGYPKLHPRTRYMSEQETATLKESWKLNKRPIIVILHGLLGGSNEYHIRASVEALTKANFNVVVLNNRGCCRSKITTPHIFTALSTDDVRFFIDKLLKEYPDQQLHLLGFSYGSALLANYVGEEKENSKLTSAIALGCPWDLFESGYHIHESVLGSKIFAPQLTKYLLNFVKIHSKMLAEDPSLEIEARIEKAKAGKFDKIWQFDSMFTAPLHGFETLSDYYRNLSPVNLILDVATPMLIINSLDDPLVSNKLPYLEVRLNPYLFLAQTDIGGHFNYVQTDGSLWFLDGMVNWYKLFEDVVGTETSHKRPTNIYSYKLRPH